MTVHEFNKEQASMSNDELIDKVEAQISSLCKTGAMSFIMRVPPTVYDTDMLLSELVRRFKLSLSPLPHQDGASADTNNMTQFKIGQKVKDDVRGYGEGVVTDSDGQWILVRFKGCYQNYTSCGRWKRDHVITLHPIEVEKAVADGASAEDVKAYALSIYKEPLNKRGEQRTQSSGQSTTPFGFTKWFSAFYKGYQFAKSEVQKSVAEKDREIAELKKYYVELDGFSHATIGRLTQALTDLSTSNAHRTRLIEAIRKWIKSWRKDQQEIRRIKSELSKANERIKELEKVLGKSPVKEIADEPRDKNGQTFDQWAEDNGCY